MPSASHSARTTWIVPSGRAHSGSVCSSRAARGVGATEVLNAVRGGMALGGIPAGLGELVALGDGEQSRSFPDAADAVGATIAASLEKVIACYQQ